MPPTTKPCLFCQIVAGAADAAVVFETDSTIGFLDIRPLFKGHVLVVPRAHVVTLDEVPIDELTPLFESVQRTCRGIVDGLGAQGTFVAMNNRVSQSVLHLHVHVVPRTKGDGLRGFFWPRTTYASGAEAEEFAGRIAASMP